MGGILMLLALFPFVVVQQVNVLLNPLVLQLLLILVKLISAFLNDGNNGHLKLVEIFVKIDRPGSLVSPCANSVDF